MDAIAVQVIPNKVTNRAKRRGRRIGWGGRWRNRLIDTGINVGQILPGRQVDRITRRITDVDVAIQVAIRALRLRAELEATGQVNPHEVTAGSQAGEAIATGTIGRDGTDKVATTAKQIDNDPACAWFAGLLDAIAVEVIPDKITNRAKLRHRGVGRRRRGRGQTVVIHTGVNVHRITRCGQRNQVRAIVGKLRNITICDIATHIRGGEDETSGQGKFDDIALAGVETSKAIVTIGIGDDCAAHLGIVVAVIVRINPEGHRDVTNANFTIILDAIAIGIIPNAITDGTKGRRRCCSFGRRGRWLGEVAVIDIDVDAEAAGGRYRLEQRATGGTDAPGVAPISLLPVGTLTAKRLVERFTTSAIYPVDID